MGLIERLHTDERNGGAQREFSTFQFDRIDDFAVINARLGLYSIEALKGDLVIPPEISRSFE